ncbi:MAG: hypothetical protein WDO73_26455 [Ignavibacteriota bacterium]
MARLGQTRAGEIQPLLERLTAVAKTPLNEIAAQLHCLLKPAALAHDAGLLPDSEVRELVRYADYVLNRLPQVFGPRFHFDAVQIAAIAEDVGRARFSGMLIPRYEQDWGHESVMMPAENGNSHIIDLVLIPGDDSVKHINLLSYPWLGHELAHNLLFRHDTPFSGDLTRELEKVVQRLKISGIADRGAAQAKATRLVEQFIQFWTPTPDHKNWAHEIAADCVALWIFGPAYMASFEDLLDDPSLNPYELTQSHPPYSVRANAIVEGARVLNWNDSRIQKAVAGWPASKWRDAKSNRIRSLASSELTDACVNAAFGTCQSLGLARCTPERLDEILRSHRAGHTPEFGVDLVLEAYVTFEKHGEQAYLQWQENVLQALAETITVTL